METKATVGTLLDALEEGTWYELSLDHGARPADLYAAFVENPDIVLMFHHFGNEPWHPKRWVMRVLVARGQEETFFDLIEDFKVVDFSEWGRAEDDRHLYGEYFWVAMEFFQASSLLAERGLTEKLVHCLLNAHGEPDSTFALRMLWNRVRVWRFLAWQKIRGRRWWE